MRRVLLVLLVLLALDVRLSHDALVKPPLPAAPLPDARHTEAAPEQDVILVYSADRVITVNREPVTRAALPRRLRDLYQARRDRTLWLSGDGTLRYGEVAEVIEEAKGAGVQRVGVITPGMSAR
jgi:biopolymer transport protein TolR